jgi:hypothetical protein
VASQVQINWFPQVSSSFAFFVWCRGSQTSIACASPLKCFIKIAPPSTRINSNKQIWHKVQPMNNIHF